MSKISVILATRNRVEKLKTSLDSLYATVSDPDNLEILLGADGDDPSLEELKNYVASHKEKNIKVQISDVRHGYKYLYKTYNPLGENAEGDWFLLWNDDAIMETSNWDLIVKEYEGQVKLLALHNTGNLEYEGVEFPLIPKSWYKATGHFGLNCHSDTWLEFIAKSLDIFTRVPIFINHPQWNKREQDLTDLEREVDHEGFFSKETQELIKLDAEKIRLKLMKKYKIGIQCLAYNCSETFPKLIEPWLKLKETHDVKIWVGSGQFKIYNEMGCKDENGSTLELLKDYLDKGHIDHLFTPDPNNLLSDHETRDKCLPYFKDEDIDLMIQLDADEFYTEKEVQNLISFIEKNPHHNTYNTIFRNLIGEDEECDFNRFIAGWIKRLGGIKGYYFDAHWWWNGENNDGGYDYRAKGNFTVPKKLVNPTHYTWTNNSNTTGPSHIKEKIEYQNKYYGEGSGFVWDEYSQSVRGKKSNSKINLIFSTAGRIEAFKRTVASLIKHNPTLNSYINKVYVIDDKSPWEEKREMEEILKSYFTPIKVSLITFNGEADWDWVDKLDFIKHLKEGADYFIYMEDDWESIASLNIEDHLSFMDFNQNIDLITFSEWWHLQKDMGIEEASIDNSYWKNPYPKEFKHTHKVENGVFYWHIVRMPHFSFNPSLTKVNIFDGGFTREKAREWDYGERNNFTQMFTKNACFNHIGDDISILTPLREKYGETI